MQRGNGGSSQRPGPRKAQGLVVRSGGPRQRPPPRRIGVWEVRAELAVPPPADDHIGIGVQDHLRLRVEQVKGFKLGPVSSDRLLCL